MAKKKISNNSIYRFMCVRSVKGTNYHTDFPTKEEALSYIDSLDDNKIEWYGLYEINELNPYLKWITSKRLINLK